MATVVETATKRVTAEAPVPVPEPMHVPERKRYLFTAEQALKMAEAGVFEGEGSVELWDGVFYKMTKCEDHNCVVMAVAIALRAIVPNNYLVREEKSCSADPLSVPEPDLMVYQGTLWDHFGGPPPPLAKMDLLVEVNVTTPEDYTTKLAKYAQAAVPTYWVVDVKARHVAVFTRPLEGTARYGESKTFARGEEIAVIVGGQTCGTIRVNDLFPPEA